MQFQCNTFGKDQTNFCTAKALETSRGVSDSLARHLFVMVQLYGFDQIASADNANETEGSRVG